ncbi:MAG: CopD family protein [Gemmatimonadales bacterium]|nr:CopD family protein [Gemmatimonadales bacterium]
MPGLGTLFPVVRGAILLAILLLIGVAVATRLARAHVEPGSGRAAQIGGWHARLPGLGAWFLLMLSLARGALQLLTFVEPGEPLESGLIQAVLLEGTWGTSWTLQTVAALVLLAGSWLVRWRPGATWYLLVTTTAVVAWAQTGMGHPTEEIWPPFTGRVVDLLHLGGAGIWLGTLAILSLTTFPVLRRAARIDELAGVVCAFSIPARTGAALLVASGVIATWQYVGSLGALFSTTYGLLVVGKVGLFVLIAAAGWWNWRILTPALAAATPDAPVRLRRAITIELAMAAVVLGLTAVLTGSSFPGTP